MQVWYKPLKADSLAVKIEKDDFVKEFYVKVKEKKSDSLAISAINSGTLHFREHFALKLNTPLEFLDVKKMKLLDADSTLVSFKTNYIPLERKIEILFKKEPATKYVFKVEAHAIQDWFGTTNAKALQYNLETKELTEYGNLKVNINSQSKYGETKETGVIFNMIKAAKPGVFPSSYQPLKELENACLFYNDNLFETLQILVLNPSIINNLKNNIKEAVKEFEPLNLYQKLIKP